MSNFLTEDEVRDNDKIILGFNEKENGVQQGTGQLTTFNQLGFAGINDKPDGWYIPDNKNEVAILLETKNSNEDIGKQKYIDEIQKNCKVLLDNGYYHVVGILHNGNKTLGFHNNYPLDIPDAIQHKQFYIDKINSRPVDTEKIYNTTKSINDNLHVNFGVKNLYHRMIFTACALVAERYNANLRKVKGDDFSVLQNKIQNTLHKSLEKSKTQNRKLDIL